MAGEVLMINPRRRRRKKATSKKRRRVQYTRRAMNPRKRRYVRRNYPKRRRRRVRHNPRILGGAIGGTVMQGVWLTGGALVTEIVADKLAGMLPAAWKTDANIVRIGTKAAVGIGLPMVLKSMKLHILPPRLLNAIALGGTVVTLLDVFKTYVGPKLGLTLAEYEQVASYEMLPGVGAVEEAYGEGAF